MQGQMLGQMPKPQQIPMSKQLNIHTVPYNEPLMISKPTPTQFMGPVMHKHKPGKKNIQ